MTNVVLEKSKAFAIDIMGFCKDLRDVHHEYEATNQLMKSGTSIGANVSEAQCGQCDADFLSKLEIATKECKETTLWLEMLCANGLQDKKDLLARCNELMRILVAIIKTKEEDGKTLAQQAAQFPITNS